MTQSAVLAGDAPEPTSDSAWQVPFAIALFAAFAGFALPLLLPAVLNDGDTNWHIATGQWILVHHTVPTTDPFSFTAAGRRWVTQEWLSEVLLALSYAAAGWNGVRLLIALAAGGAAFLLARGVLARAGNLAAALMLAFSFWVLGPHVQARPHMLALPVLLIWTLEMMRARDKDRAPPLWLLPIMLLWANLHASYIMGIGFAGFFALEAFLAGAGRRIQIALRWCGFLLACVLICLITPNGVDGMAYPFKVMTLDLQPITEWRPLLFSRFEPIEPALFAALAGALWLGVRVPPVRLLLLLVLLFLTFQHIRQEIVFATVAPLLLAQPFGEARDTKPAPIVWPPMKELATPIAVVALLFAGLAGWRLIQPNNHPNATNVPLDALNHVPASLRAKPVFNDYAFGGWLIFNGVRPFIDGRSDMYGDNHLKTYLDVDSPAPKNVDAAFSRYGIAWAILRPNSGLVRVLDAKPGWRRLYTDRWAVVEVRGDATDNPAKPR